MSTFVMSDKYPQFIKEIEEMGHKVIKSDTIDVFHSPEQKHADMQILPIHNDIFILNECTNLKIKLNENKLLLCKQKAGKMYPENILLNFLFLNNTLYGKLSAIDSNLLEYSQKKNIKTINVTQGYTRCSTLAVTDNAVITSDVSIKKVMENVGVDVLLISYGNIVLDGFNYGFIGGASGKLDKNTIVFFGNAENHPDFEEIKQFCYKHNSKIEILCKTMPLTDIGGIVKVG